MKGLRVYKGKCSVALRHLRGLSYQYGQGYFFASPLVVPEPESLLKAQFRW